MTRVSGCETRAPAGTAHGRVLLCALALLHACASDPMGSRASTAGDAADVSGTTTNGSRASSGHVGPDETLPCRLDATPPSGSLSIEVAGTVRDYELVLPKGYDGRTRFPVLFAWHGTSTSGLEFIDLWYGRITDGVAGRALIVAPDGLIENEGEWAGLTRWQLSNLDGALFDALLNELNREYCMDPKRVFSTGHSIGGYFTHYLGCTRGDRLRAIAPVAAGGPSDTSDCIGHPAVMIAHNPHECAEVAPPHCPAAAVPWATEGWPSTQFWAARNGCDDPGPMPTAELTGEPPCQPLAGCDPRSPVTLCLYDFSTNVVGPHAWPTYWMADAIMDAFLRLP